MASHDSRPSQYENNLFLTFRSRVVTVWNFKGEQVTTFEDHVLWHPVRPPFGPRTIGDRIPGA